MRFLGLLTLLLLTAVSDGQEASSPSNDTESLAGVYEMISAGEAVLIDVRSDKEWKASHLDGAQHVPLRRMTSKKMDPDALDRLDKQKTVYVHCAKGKRACVAAEYLKELGFNVIALDTDYESIRAAGFDEVKDETVD